MKFEQHPLSAAFPSMGADDFQALKDDIEMNGQREPVMIYDGMVLDGWHRYRACIELGTKPTQFNFSDEDDPAVFVLSQNLHRRHLTAPQRAAAILECSAWHPAHREKKWGTNAPLPQIATKTNAEMAKAAKVSVHTIKDVKAAKTAGLIDLVVEGAVTAKEAGKIARGTVSKPEPKSEAVEPTESDDDDPIAILSDENDRLNDRLAVVAMDATPEERTAATDAIQNLRSQVKTLTATLAAVTASRDSYMRELSDVKRQCAGYKRQLDKIKKG